uniref:Uncharacterized protein n=1 Tax=viral metagenome TaxID=1070528 RepID=A0A6C0BKA6_9ZZZZ
MLYSNPSDDVQSKVIFYDDNCRDHVPQSMQLY